MKQAIKLFLAIATFIATANIGIAQTPYDDFAPSSKKREMLKLPETTFRAYNTDTTKETRYIELDKESLVLSYYNQNGTVIKQAFLKPTDFKFLSVDPAAKKNPFVTPYAFVNNNPIIYTDPDGNDWILVTGNQAQWYGGKTGDKSNLLQVFKASSGNDHARLFNKQIINLQQAKYQYVKGGGPTPEGLYSINLKPDPNRIAEIDKNTNQLLRSSEGGIEKIPGNGSSDWGSNRAYLYPIKVTGATTKERDNDTYYLHDSQKGFTHGCTECETEIFTRLKEYRKAGNKDIDVVVKYPSPEHKTNGGTKKETKKSEHRPSIE